MRQAILFLTLLIGFQSQAENVDRELPRTYVIDSVQVNKCASKKKSEVVIHVKNNGFKKGDQILYGFDGNSLKATLNNESHFKFKLDSGEHFFQFYPSEKFGYAEITTHKIKLDAGTTTYISLIFQGEVREQMNVRKPVIYLYPVEKTEVSVVVKPKGEMSFTYPEYDESWNCTALPSGEILIHEDSFNYLFWESEQTTEVENLNQTLGIVVLKEDLVKFLESSLSSFGFTSQERMDFITFWAPEMIQHEATEIRFLLNDDCRMFADLEINPIPDNLLRFYMVWNPSDEFYHDSKSTLAIPTQDRTGFTVLEWGGTEIPRGTRLENVSE